LKRKPDVSPSARFHIAQQLAQSLSYVHTYGFVHKGIRPETVLVFQNERSEIAASFLLGFENFRTAEGRTLKASDTAWEKNLYRRPRRQGLRPEDEYVMQHDNYSLGVCLVEIGLWRTFVAYPDATANKPMPSNVFP
jgi:serine/threonine protein kinase